MKLAAWVMIGIASGASVARAEPREVVAEISAGVAAAAPPEASVSSAPLTAMFGGSLAWERPLPQLAPLVPARAEASVAPALSVSVQGARTLVLGGARFELGMTNRRLGGAQIWLAPQAGALSGAASPVLGGEVGIALRVHGAWRAGVVYGVYGVRESAAIAASARSASSAMPEPAATSTVVDGQLAVVLGHRL